MKQLVLPEEKLNALAQEISDRLLQSHYFNQGIIRGEELKDFAEHSQINKFLLFQVYQVWNMQISKLKHPYFDFEHAQIQDHLQLLRNLLSQHIRISQQDFKPMLKRAVYNNLKLLIDPKESFTSFFFANREKTPLELYERYTPFFSDFDFIVNSILHYHKKHHMEMVEKDIFFLKMEKSITIFNQKSGKDFEAYRREIIEQLTEGNLDELLKSAEEEEKARKARLAEEARRKAEAETRLQEEEKRKLEEAKQKEEELRRIAEEKSRLEEEAKRREEEEAMKRQSFFDTLSETSNFFDLEDSEETEETEEIDLDEAEAVHDGGEAAPNEIEIALQDEARRKQEENLRQAAEAARKIEEEAKRRAEEETQRQKEAEETQRKEEERLAAEEAAETKRKEEEAKRIEEERRKAETEVKKQHEAKEAAQKAAEEEALRNRQIAEETSQKEEEQTIADKLAASVNKTESSILDRFKKKEEETPKEEEEDTSRPKTIAERLAEAQGNGEKTETTTSFLDRFLNNKKEKKPEAKAAQESKEVSAKDAPKTVAEQLEQDKPKTLAERFQESSPKKVHQNLNGDKKIKLNEIPIHKQYQYVQKVFDGNNVRFRIIVDKVNNAKAKDEVEEILQKFVLSKDDIDHTDSVVQEFIELLRNRF